MSTADATPQEQAAQAAAAAAAKEFNSEVFALLALGILITALRTYSRISSVGFKNLQLDDLLVWLAAIFYAAETALAYSVGNAAHGLANNGMTPAERQALSSTDPEYGLRTLGSKIQLAGWTVYGSVLWSLKGSLLVFYTRLTAGLGGSYEIRIYIGYVAVAASYIIVIFNLFLGCRPLHRNWQIEPDPGNVCQPAVSGHVVWVYFAFNVITDAYLLSIPLPMLFKASIKPLRKFALIVLFGGGIFVIACATLRCVLIVADPVHGAQLAGSWAVRETFVALVTTNLPMVYPVFKKLLEPYIGTWLSSTRSQQRANGTSGPSAELVTIGRAANKSGGLRSNPMTDVTFTESEERIMGVPEAQESAWPSESGSVKKAASVQTHEMRKDVEVHVVSQDNNHEDSEGVRQRQLATMAFETDPDRHQGHLALVRGPSKPS